jgi:hypothetical protein
MGAARSHIAVAAAAVVAAAAAAMACLAPAGAAFATPPVSVAPVQASSAPGGTWGPAESLSGVSTEADAVYPAISSVSCPSAGSCSASGEYGAENSTAFLPFLVSETDGAWGTTAAVPGLAALNTDVAQVGQISCGSAGNCSAIGYYTDSERYQHAFVVDETSGSWADLEDVPGVASLAGTDAGDVNSVLASVSCASPGNCSAGGNYQATGSETAFLVNEVGGTWADAEPVPGLNSLGGSVLSTIVSLDCASAGNCTAVGSDGTSADTTSFVVTETDGIWGDAVAVPGILIASVSCGSPGNCSASGSYPEATGSASLDQAFVVNEVGGVWGEAQIVPGVATLDGGDSSTGLYTSCASAGNCTASGTYELIPAGGGLDYLPFVVSEDDGTWGTATPIPGLSAIDTRADARVNALSCGSPGNCSAGGWYNGADGQQAFVASEADGTWTAEEVPGPAISDAAASGVEAVSCAGPGYCSAGGYFDPTSEATGGFVVNEATASATSLTLTGATSAYGNEQTVHASVTVTSADGTPTGTVLISAGSTGICEVELTAGSGTCTPHATGLPPGSYQLTAGYSGDSTFVVSSSAAADFTVTLAGSKTGLTLSEQRVRYGHETSEKLSVTVSAQYTGVPSGEVVLKVGGTVICSLALRSGRASCRLTARQLKAGHYHLTATYKGSPDFAVSAAAKTLVVK